MINSTMKHYQSILFALCGLLLLTLGILVYQVYDSGVGGRERCKREAELSLKSAAELWVNREFDKLGIPFYYEGGEPKTKNKVRRMVLAEGEFVVEIDSLKEVKRLTASWMLGLKTRVLFLLDTPPVLLLNELWQKELDSMKPYCSGAFVVQSELPDKKKGEKFIAGDSTLMTDKYKLGDYYLDDMYFLSLVAYLSVPSLWLCADWGGRAILSCLVMIAILLSVLIFFFLHNRNKQNNVETNPSDDFVMCISERKYQIAGVLFDEEAGTLTFEDKNTVKCAMQLYKLLSAFVHAKSHFLPNDRIVEICSWSAEDCGINEKRRVTVSLLRKLLDSEKSHVNLVSGRNEEYGIYRIILIEQ